MCHRFATGLLRFLLLAVGADETLVAVWVLKLRTGAAAVGVRLALVASSSLGWFRIPSINRHLAAAACGTENAEVTS